MSVATLRLRSSKKAPIKQTYIVIIYVLHTQ